MSVRLFAALALALGALVLPAAGRADGPALVGTVGPSFTITLRDAAGNPFQHLDPGAYTITIHDEADIHDFHLLGPGVDVTTGVEETGDTVWNVTLTDGTYTFLCDPHSTTMRGTFTVGSGAAATTTTVPTPAPKPVVGARLAAAVGPGFAISLTSGGAPVKRLRPGRYTIVVRDLATIHDFELAGPGVQRATTVAGRGTFTWRITLKQGVYRYSCGPHRATMHGSFRVS